MKTSYYKITAIISFIAFLFTVFKLQAIILLAISAYFCYVYCVKSIQFLTQKDLIQFLPKKIKKHIQQKSLADYVASLHIVQNTPMLNYFVPFLKQMSKEKQNQIELTNLTKTTSAINIPNNNSHYQQTRLTQTHLKMVRQPLSSQINLEDRLIQQTLKMGLKSHILSEIDQPTYTNGKMIKQESGNMTTCESTNDFLPKRPYNSFGKRKSSLVIKKKFAEESSSNEEPLSNIDHKRLHKSTSESKLLLKPTNPHIIDHKDHSTHRSVEPHVQNPIKTVEEYVKALIWMMKRLLGLRKMTSKIRRASMVSVASAAAVFWVIVYLQIKMDKKKGKIIFKTLKALFGTLLVLSATGTTGILGYKLYKRITVGEQPPRKSQQFSLFYDNSKK